MPIPLLPLPVWLIATNPEFWKIAHFAVTWSFITIGSIMGAVILFNVYFLDGPGGDMERTGWGLLGIAVLGAIFGAWAIPIAIAVMVAAGLLESRNQGYSTE